MAPTVSGGDGGGARGLQAGGVQGLLSPWLTLRELCAVGAASKLLRAQLAAQTWELTVSDVRSTELLLHATRQFPNVQRLRVHRVFLPAAGLTHALSALLASNWTLRELELRHVWCLHDGHVRILAQEWPTLERLSILQCDQIKSPGVCGPSLRSLVVQSQSMLRFHEDSSFPVLQHLTITSHVMSAMDVRALVRQTLHRVPTLDTLDLSGSSSLEQVLIDPGDLPGLKTLRLRGCLALERLHVSSKLLLQLDVRLCDHLSHAALDLPSIVQLDLSLLKNLTHLYVRSRSLTTLSVRGDTFLEHKTTQILCPNMAVIDLQGTELTASKVVSFEEK